MAMSPIAITVAPLPSCRCLVPRDRRWSDGGGGVVVGGGRGVVTAKATALEYARAVDIRAESMTMARAADAPVYSPEILDRKYGSSPMKVLRRALKLMTGLCSLGLKLWLDHLFGVIDQNKRMRAEELRTMFTHFGPTFVKIGQGLSTRPDLCPPEYIEELSKLQDALPTVPDKEAFDCIEKELDLPLDSIVSTISASPVAAASLGQVYKARLKNCGKLVAVKVQRPDIEEVIGLDFFLMRSVGFLIDKYVGSFTTDLVPLIDEFARRIYQELNYVQEAHNSRKFKKLYADKEKVIVPDIFWDYTSGKVLTMEWIQGLKLSEHDAIEEQGLNLLDLVNTGIQCTLRQLLECGFFHADPHPGNLLVTPEGKLAFIDFGMMSETPETARYAIVSHVVHLVNRDYEAMARDYNVLGFLPPEVDVTPIVPALRSYFDDALNATVSELNFKSLVDSLGAVFYRFPFNVPPYYVLILRSLTVLEGLALSIDPNFKVLEASYPYFAKRLLTDPSPYLRDALIEVLFKDGRFRWNRLENLLIQGSKDRDFAIKDALQPVLRLLLDPDGEELRLLVVKEAVLVTEAIVLCSAIDIYDSLPPFIRCLMANENGKGPLTLSNEEFQSVTDLRDRVYRIWRLLQISENFDPAILLPMLQVIQQQEVRILGVGVAIGVSQRLVTRMLQQLLQTSQAASSASSKVKRGQRYL